MDDMPRPEHPRPDMRRADDWWLNLNGEWQFEIDRAVSGEARGYAAGRDLDATIVVPFCPESRLSSVQDVDFHNCVWYRKLFRVPQAWNGRRVLLRVGACDYRSTVWLNGEKVGEHEGGYTPFTCDLTDALEGSRQELVIRAVDPIRHEAIPCGKQSRSYASHGCVYTRTTGIWQTVWLEAVPQTYVSDMRIWPDYDRGKFTVEIVVSGDASFEGRAIARAEEVPAASTAFRGRGAGCYRVELTLEQPRPWSPEDPFLHHVVVELHADGYADRVSTWAGLRKIHIEGKRILLNNEPIFLRTVLDQGFYPDGVYTAPSAEELARDIDMSLAFGFNGARLHEKVFEPLFLHYCDRKGYLVFGEFPDWGRDFADARCTHSLIDQWTEALQRDLSHPSLIGWCPLNESRAAGGSPYGECTTRRLYRLTKLVDPTRPVIDASGYLHFQTDIYDTHDYNQDAEAFAASYAPLAQADYSNVRHWPPEQMRYEGKQPYFVSEYGGIGWRVGDVPGNAWGYGAGPQSEEEFLRRFRELTEALLFNPGVSAFCYTQLTDVEQEVNGLMTYDRRPKFPPESIAEVLRQTAAVER